MMLRTRYFRCPDCGGIFGVQYHLTEQPPPDFCGVCGNSMIEPETAFVPAAPYVSDKTIGKTADALYRQHETASREAAEAVAAMTGERPHETGMLVTDMRDRLREGDIAAAPMPSVNSPVVQRMAQGGGGFNGGGGGSQVAQAAATGYAQTREGQPVQGIYPRAGDTARQNLVSRHHEVARQIESIGRLARARES